MERREFLTQLSVLLTAGAPVVATAWDASEEKTQAEAEANKSTES